MPVTAADAKDPAGKLRGSSVPWRRMLLHPAVWAIVVNNYTFHYAFYVVMNWLPTYFEQVTLQPAAGKTIDIIRLSAHSSQLDIVPDAEPLLRCVPWRSECSFLQGPVL